LTDPDIGFGHCGDCDTQLVDVAPITLPSANGYDANGDMKAALEGGPCPGCGRRIDKVPGLLNGTFENFNWCDDCEGLGLEWREGRWFRQPLTSRRATRLSAPSMPADVEMLQRSLRGLRSGFAVCVSEMRRYKEEVAAAKLDIARLAQKLKELGHEVD